MGVDTGAELRQVEARVANRLAHWLDGPGRRSALDDGGLPPGVAERLRFAREQAVARARTRRRVVAAADAPVAGGPAAALGRAGPWWTRAAVWLPALVLGAGMYLMSVHEQRETARIAADVDARLLADSVPPAAYADPGFVAFLKLQQP